MRVARNRWYHVEADKITRAVLILLALRWLQQDPANWVLGGLVVLTMLYQTLCLAELSKEHR